MSSAAVVDGAQSAAVVGLKEKGGNAAVRKSARNASDAARNASTNFHHPWRKASRSSWLDAKHGGISVRACVAGRSNGEDWSTRWTPSTGGSLRANRQVSKWNAEVGNAGRHVAEVVEDIPAGGKARELALAAERVDADALRAAGQLNDPRRHVRP
jgi:hypothetical protein